MNIFIRYQFSFHRFLILVRLYLIKRWREKERVGYTYLEGDVEWDEKATIKYPSLCFFAGFFAGLFGVGGGIVKGPLMLEMGVDPQVPSNLQSINLLPNNQPFRWHLQPQL